MKLQSAMEYLVTYGWILLIVGIVVAALYSLGVFGGSNFTPQQCVAPNGFECISYAMSVNGILRVVLLQDTSTPINVTGVGCTQNSTSVKTQKPFNPPSNIVYMPIGSQRNFTVQCYTSANTAFSTTLGGIFDGYIVVNYTTLSHLKSAEINESAVGVVVSKASTTNSFPTTSLASSSTLSSSSSTLSSSTLSSSTLSSSSSTLSSTTTTTIALLGTYTYSYTGGSQTFTAPSLTTYIVIKTWGAGGGGGFATGGGGGGGFVEGTFTTSSGTVFTVYVGGGGDYADTSSGGYPNGVATSWSGAGAGAGSSYVTATGLNIGAGGGGGAADGNTGAGALPGGGGGYNTSSSSSGGNAGERGGIAPMGNGGIGGYSSTTGTSSVTVTGGGNGGGGAGAAAGTGDPNYPGSDIGYGGASGDNGYNGYVTILAYGT